MRLTTVCLTSLALTLAACQPAVETDAGTGAQSGASAPTGEAATTTAPDANTVTAEGWGPLRIGMTLDEVVAAAGPDSDPEAVGGPDPESCDQFRPEQAPEGLLVMIEQGILTSISLIDDSHLRTDRGFGVGSSAAEIKAAYGDAAIVEAHHYVGLPAEYITVWATGRDGAEYIQDPAARGVRYETNADGAVNVIHVGGPSIQYVEGCA